MGKAALDFYLRKHNFPKATKIIMKFSQNTANRYSEFHPDVGRAALLIALIAAGRAEDRVAIDTSELAVKILEVMGPADFDLQAAKFFHHEIIRAESGARDASEPAIVGLDTPAGLFFMDLK